jgi:3-oxoacyl-[acyl-carrier protein] reductase
MSKRNALITGGSRGIGKAIAEKFKKMDYEVFTPDREELDLLSNSSIDGYIDKVSNVCFDLIINNAGINPLSGILEVQNKDFDDTIQINLTAPMRIIRGVIPNMIIARYGRIINISSIWGTVTKMNRVSYTTSKSAINGLTRSIAVELSQYNILVNSIAPGFVNTELTRGNNSKEEIAIIASTIPIQRLAEPEEIAEIITFFGTEKNSYITGQTIMADGGYTCL